MSSLEWAKREVELACQRENLNRKDGEFDYGCACYESALKAFESLYNDNHSGFSIKLTQVFLNRLIDGQPLTPIEGTDDDWSPIGDVRADGRRILQCKRMSSLFKTVHPDGAVTYSDTNRVYCANIDNPGCTYYSGLVRSIIDKIYPITMPYFPGKPIKVICECFLTDKANGDFDTVGVLYSLIEGFESKKNEINRFFREPFENEPSSGWVEISKEEYEERKSKKFERN